MWVVSVIISFYIIQYVWDIPSKEVVNEIVKSVKEPKVVDSAQMVGKNLGMYYWHLGYMQGADAAIESIKSGNTGNFSNQMKVDSLNLELIINRITDL